MIDLVLLGCGGNMPMPNRFLSSLFINYKGRKILIDCGEGTQVAIRRMGLGFKAIDLIFITHCHGDHVVVPDFNGHVNPPISPYPKIRGSSLSLVLLATAPP